MPYAPIILSEELQQLATELKIATRLNIAWADAKPREVKNYFGVLAAANTLAEEIGKRHSRQRPNRADFLAAFAALCFWPPNKPPVVQKYWHQIYPVLHDYGAQNALKKRVGELAIALGGLSQEQQRKVILSEWPRNEADYLDKVLNIKKMV